MNISIHPALAFVLGATLFGFLNVAIAWTAPTGTPPNNNVSAPVNVGVIDQIKSAGLGVNSLAVYGNAILNGTSRYLNFGTTAGSSGYGIRDNAGTLEFKNNGGAWQNRNTIAGGVRVGGIVFPDGTVQTTAYTPTPVTYLYGSIHTTTDCTAAGGSARPRGAGLDSLCVFSGASCASGWTRLQNWTTTQNVTRSCGSGACASSGSSGSHAYANIAPEVRNITCYSWRGGNTSGCEGNGSVTAAATIVEVGCY